ncbi:BON domain-containing protein [Eikenella sp. S3360]|uniref:BON domain-containing protein n=1 Tax=Eikenella glucosivorans TaxID=2766967 RepID=A0ABS0N8D2_9NEIS|nr:BON domain-containing protein [Eikenella glucosivorans]MBH5328531.1 BON domain-containing protein [Eikenella glucosivorans]
MKKSFRLLLLCLLPLSLSGCFAAVAGAGALGVMSATDRRSTGAQADDQVMEVRIQNTALTHLRNSNTTPNFEPKLSVVSFNRQILLMGLVASEADKEFAERVARSQPNAEKIYNHIQVAAGERGFGDVSNDSWITSKVRTTLIGTKGVSANHVKVVTYNGITYVMGILTPEEQARVSETVSTTAGVRQVVTLYETFVPSNAR